MALLCLNFYSKAQDKIPNPSTTINSSPTLAELGALKLQQPIPVGIWNAPIEILGTKGEISNITLNNYKGKLIILDFWATWCTACIKTFPHLDSLQNQFKDKVQILLVNAKIKGDTAAKMHNRLKDYQLTSIINNEELKLLFPYEFIPHYVWIDGQGRLYAITTAEMINETSIKNYLNHNP